MEVLGPLPPPQVNGSMINAFKTAFPREPSPLSGQRPQRGESSSPSALVLPTVVNDELVDVSSTFITQRSHSTTCIFPHTLTPILASPISTPTQSSSSKYPAAEQDTISNPPLGDQDYLSAGGNTSLPNMATPTWIAIPPTPPKLAIGSAIRKPSTSIISPSASLPAALLLNEISQQEGRRASLPPMAVSKPLPPTPHNYGNGLNDSSLRPGRPKTVFHIANDGSDDEHVTLDLHECVTIRPAQDRRSSRDSLSHPEKEREKVKRYHALMELLTTEMGYLMDLRVLVTIYIRQLSTLTSQSPSSTSHFGSSSNVSPFMRTSSSTFLSTTFSSSIRSNVASTTSTEGPPNKDKERHTPRYLFSNKEIYMVTRNIEEILLFHERFVGELRTAVAPFGFASVFDIAESGDDVRKQFREGIGPVPEGLDTAIATVQRKFTTQASRFGVYEIFCSGHPEAFDLVRRIQQQYPTEWETFERKSSSLASTLSRVDSRSNPSSPVSTGRHEHPDLPEDSTITKRRHSLSSLDMPPRSSLQGKIATNIKWANESEQGHSGTREKDQVSRLTFIDYLIKPVQRICKYPLLLDQLRSAKLHRRTNSQEAPNSSSSSSDAHPGSGVMDVNIGTAASYAMRQVASSVDEARRRQDIATKSALIASRISQACSQPASSGSQPSQQLNVAFLSSLGACLLSGALDVIYHHSFKISSSSAIKAKYLGAFLYVGGYFVLVKVGKGKIYEPRHWFSLVGFEVVDVEEDDALLPCSFRLSYKGHVFELAAACQREKDLWVSGIRESLNGSPSWINEPTSSLQFEDKGQEIPEVIHVTTDPGAPCLPTIQSIPELDVHEFQDEIDDKQTELAGESRILRPFIHSDTSNRYESPQAAFSASRKSSTTSVKAIFSSMSSDADTIHIRRSSPAARLQVERGLLDVFSELCLSARFYAHTHDEELFQAPRLTITGFSKSNSGLGMAGAMGVAAKNRLTRRESVLVSRKKSFSTDITCGDGLSKPLSGSKSLAHRRRVRRIPLPVEIGRESRYLDFDPMPDSPTPLSQCSSISASNPGSSVASPVVESMYLPASNPPGTSPVMILPNPALLAIQVTDNRPKRTRSMVSNFRGLFHNRSTSPTTYNEDHARDQQHQSGISPSLRRWWSKGTLRRRVRSAPDVPGDETPSSTVTYGSVTPQSESSSDSGLRPLAFLSEFGENGKSSPRPSRRRTLFSYRRATDSDLRRSDTTPRKLQRNLSLLQHFGRLTPTKDPS